MLTAADLAFMQDTQDEALPGTVVIERYSLISNGLGGGYEAWAAVGTVMGRIYPQRRRGTNEPVAGAMLTSEMQWFGTLPYGTSVTARDRLVYEGKTWEILTVNNGEMWKTAVRCELQSNNEERRT